MSAASPSQPGVQQEIEAQRERDVEQQFAGGQPGAV
jgi:hypothetical protein